MKPTPDTLTTNGAAASAAHDEPLLTPAQVAQLLGVTTSWVYERADLPRYKLGKFVRFARRQVLAWLEQQREGER
jgi:excisionase family DNA binding protein